MTIKTPMLITSISQTKTRETEWWKCKSNEHCSKHNRLNPKSVRYLQDLRENSNEMLGLTGSL